MKWNRFLPSLFEVGVSNFLIFLPGVWAADVTSKALVAIWNYDVSLKMQLKPKGEKHVWRAGDHGAVIPSCTAQPQNFFFFAVTFVNGFSPQWTWLKMLTGKLLFQSCYPWEWQHDHQRVSLPTMSSWPWPAWSHMAGHNILPWEKNVVSHHTSYSYTILSLVMFPTIHCCVCMRGEEKGKRKRVYVYY